MDRPRPTNTPHATSYGLDWPSTRKSREKKPAASSRRRSHVITEYAKWAEQAGDASNSPFKGLSDPAVLRQSGLFAAWTPDQLLAKVPAMPDRSTFGFQPLVGGLSPEEGWKSLELLKQTMPKLRAAVAALD
jgi:hypothetical protein